RAYGGGREAAVPCGPRGVPTRAGRGLDGDPDHAAPAATAHRRGANEPAHAHALRVRLAPQAAPEDPALRGGVSGGSPGSRECGGRNRDHPGPAPGNALAGRVHHPFPRAEEERLPARRGRRHRIGVGDVMETTTVATAPPGRAARLLAGLGLQRKELRSWAMYDWANSAFITTIGAAVLPIYYSRVAAGDLSPVQATAYWGYTNSIALAIIAVAAPVLGAMGDYLGAKKRFLAAFMLIGVIASAGLYLVQRGDWLLASTLYLVGSIGFTGSLVFADSLLPHIAREHEIDRVSTAGYALGYLGGGVLLAINALMI